MKLLENTHITLRAVEPTDLDIIFQWENNPDIWQYGSTMAPYSKRQICEYIKNYSADIFKDMQLRLMVVEKTTNMAIGMVDMFDFNPFHSRVHIGILISPEYAGCGYGYEAAMTIISYAKDFLGIHQIIADIATDNLTSIHLFEKLGFTRSGILKDWLRVGKTFRDVAVMQKIL